MNPQEKFVFFVNIYNCLCLHGFISLEVGSGVLGKYVFYKKARYKIGSFSLCLLEIEYAILRHSSAKPALGRFHCSSLTYYNLATIMKFFRMPKYSKSDPRYILQLTRPEPLVNFVLYAGTGSSPPVNVYTLHNYYDKMMNNARELMGKIEMTGFSDYDSVKTLVKYFDSEFTTDRNCHESSSGTKRTLV